MGRAPPTPAALTDEKLVKTESMFGKKKTLTGLSRTCG